VAVADHLPLPQAHYHVLVALSGGTHHGYAVMQAVEESSNGVVRMGPATLYGTLRKLCDAQLVEEVQRRPDDDDDPRRRYYQLTSLGRKVCLAESDRLASLVARSRANLRPRTA
jgi:DNA-binding PadR family transcriptional regulator